MLFAESVLKRGGEVHIFLPFDIETFIEYSVRLVPRDELAERFHRILDSAASVRILNEKGDPDDGAAYDYCNRVLAGAAILKSQFLGMDIAPILLWDGKRGDGGGGTESVRNYWRHAIHQEVEIVPMDQILAAALANGLALPEPAPKPAGAAGPAGRTPQEIRAMLFADVVGFSKWPEQCVPLFIREFLGRVAAIQEKNDARPLYVNTWGDAIDAFEQSKVIPRIFAPEMIRNLLLTKKQERHYMAELSPNEQVEIYLDTV